MTTIDEIEELRAELRHCRLTAAERRNAETKLAALFKTRNLGPCDDVNRSHVASHQARSGE